MRRIANGLALLFALVAMTFSPGIGQARQSAHPWYGCGTYRTTAYLATGSRTATGYWPYYGEIAVDPNVIPLYSHVYIRGLGVFRALDTGGAVWGRHLDIFAYSMAQAYYVQGTGYRYACWW